MERDGPGAGNPAISCGNNVAFGFDASAKPVSRTIVAEVPLI
jgi:hypothetical protein